MRKLLSALFSPPPFQHEAHVAYAALVAKARDPFFYTQCAVPDTLDGRFDVIVLHLFLLLSRLKEESDPRAAAFSRALQEAFFTDMDRSIREMGSTDTGVGKRIKAMAQAFFGRLQAYEQAVAEDGALEGALGKNLYRGNVPPSAVLQALVAEVRRRQAGLRARPLAPLLAGQLD
jgi:cytochrome b pre-mRNA-processing protein 3